MTAPGPDTPPADRLTAILGKLRAFVAERQWEQFHDPKNLAMLVGSEAGELLAELRWVPNDAADSFGQDSSARARIAAEVADVAIALFLLCDRLDIDLLAAVETKIEVNRRHYPPEASRGRWDRPADG
ncbi:MAG: nucleotide pyrophosphohydrolase [Anaerolineae bacterium]